MYLVRVFVPEIFTFNHTKKRTQYTDYWACVSENVCFVCVLGDGCIEYLIILRAIV